MGYSWQELKALFDAKSVRPQVIDGIYEELLGRKSRANKLVLQELLKKYPRLQEPAKTVKKKQAAKKAVARAEAPARSQRTHDGPIVFKYEENSVAYEFLRNTFTEEGELLAKWGMTPTLPEDVIEKTFKHWEEHLAKNTDPMFRTIPQLKIDKEKFAKLRARAKRRAEGK
jgi:hypothetical protein